MLSITRHVCPDQFIGNALSSDTFDAQNSRFVCTYQNSVLSNVCTSSGGSVSGGWCQKAIPGNPLTLLKTVIVYSSTGAGNGGSGSGCGSNSNARCMPAQQ
jgi:hypothetical protein